MSEPFIGEIRIMPYIFAPRDWAWCNGQILQIEQNTTLFAIIGTIYGGNGRTTFALPDLRNKAPMHAGQGPGLYPRRVGGNIGTNTVALQESQIPSHNHLLHVSRKTPSDESAAADNRLPHKLTNSGGSSQFAYVEQAVPVPYTPMSNNSISVTGQSIGHENRQPYLTTNYCIALHGLWPPRS